ncbi:MAG: DUF4230 domain-containing protein [Lewinellaceae bacterium]|nr:DUF4230 domain-containing protein [Lewinellaceae bacterium]
MSKRIVQIALFLIVFLVGGWLGFRYFTPQHDAKKESTILLEKIREVCKLITVEGQFSEIYSHSEYEGYFTMFWDKKVLVRVRATVAAGYDLDQLDVHTDLATKTVYMSSLPQPQILSIDHELDYYNISNGLFTAFSPEDYNRINSEAKELIRKKAGPLLLPAAEQQASKMINLIRFMVESNGWTLVVDGQEQHLPQ